MIIFSMFHPPKICNLSNLPKKRLKQVSWFDPNPDVLRSIQTFCLVVKPHQTSIFFSSKLITFYILKKKRESMFHPSNSDGIRSFQSMSILYDFPSSLGWSLHALEPRSKRAETERGARKMPCRRLVQIPINGLV